MARPAYTLIELLVSVGVISLLASLLLPSVQKTRESARQTQCKNNLKQIALAVHHFEASHGRIPPSDLGKGWTTWATLVLPYLDQSVVYDKWDLKLSYYSQVGCDLDPPVYECPSRRVDSRAKGDPKVFPRDGIRTGPLGWSDFAAVAGTDIVLADGAFVRAINGSTGKTVAISLSSPITQFLDPKYPIGFRNFTDGTSSTLLFGEKHLPLNDYDPSVYNGDLQRSYLRACGPAFRLVANPNYSDLDGRARFGSAHPGICHFAFVDGSVRGINVTIDHNVLGHLATRAGAEVIPDNY